MKSWARQHECYHCGRRLRARSLLCEAVVIIKSKSTIVNDEELIAARREAWPLTLYKGG